MDDLSFGADANVVGFGDYAAVQDQTDDGAGGSEPITQPEVWDPKKYTIVSLRDRGEEDYRLIWIPKALRDHAGLRGRAGSKLYVILDVPKLDMRGRLKRKKDGALKTYKKTILTQWEMKTGDGTFNRNTVAFNEMIRESFKAEFKAIDLNLEGKHATVTLTLDKSIKFFDGIWYAIWCDHPDRNVNVAMLFLYLSLIPTTIFFLLGMAVEIFGVNDMIRHTLGLH